jgi:lactate permease
MKGSEVKKAWSDSAKMLAMPAFALLFAVALVRVFIDSGTNTSGLDSMPIVLAEYVAYIAGGTWPFFAPIIGALGAFVAGSNTVSDLMFSLFQYGVADRIGAPHLVILGMQALGGAAGNMITVHNVVAASATVGLVGREGLLISRTILPMTYYVVAAGSLGLLFAYVLFPGTF